MTLTRSGGNLAITGQISGGSYLSTFSLPAFSSATFPANGSFNFNRVGFFLGNNVNAQGGSTFSNVVVETNVPEPASLALWVARLAWLCLLASELTGRFDSCLVKAEIG